MIKVAEHSGFCFGVSRAVSAIDALIEKNEGRIYTLGSIIHNPSVTERLKKAGVRIIGSADIDPIYETAKENDPVTVVIRTHGAEKSIIEKLEELSGKNPYFKAIDCTCPFVCKIHDIVKDNSEENGLTVIFGTEDHPEVVGIKSYVRGTAVVTDDPEKLEAKLQNIPEPENGVIAVSQTTQNQSKWKLCQKILKKLYTRTRIFDTICSVTEKRQEETARLAADVDVMIVIGGKNSSNTNKLFDISKALCERTYLVETSDECGAIRIDKKTKVGITAGASTPDSIIEEVKTKMSEEIKDTEVMTGAPDQKEVEESFEKMLDETFKTLNTGDVVTGTITQISPTEIKVDLGTKVTGILSYDDITDEPGVKLDEVFKLGDQVTAYAVRVSDVDGVATLSKRKYDAKNNWQKAVAAYESGEFVEGKFIEVVRGGAICSISGVRAFVPASHTTVEEGGDMNALIGQKMLFKILEVDPARKRIKASARIPARAAARAERKAAEAKFWEEIEEGFTYEGIVRSIQPYGAFVELGAGVDGMVHTTDLSWRHISSPADVVSVGDKIKVFVKSVDKEKKRISLGYRTEETNPWTMFVSQYHEGDVITVKIVGITPFGAFGEILPGVDGLIHISQLSLKRVEKPEDVVSMGEEKEVKITGIDYDKKKVNLSIRELLEPEPVAEEPAEEQPAEEPEAPAEQPEAPAEEKPETADEE